MSDISIKEMIKFTESKIRLPDCIEYKAELNLGEVGYLSTELMYQNRDATLLIQRLKNRLVSQILDTIYREVIDKLDVMCQELLSNARGISYEAYEAKLDMAQKLRKLANELRGS